MLLPRLALVCSLSMLVAAAACQGKGTAPTPVADAKANQGATKAAAPTREAKTDEVGPPQLAADGGPTPSEIAAVDAASADQGPKQGPVASLQGDPEKALGAHLVDPRWFRKTMFGDAGKVLDTKRSQADEQGRFSSLIRFELPDMKPEGCADHLQALVKDEVPEVKRETKPDGRVQLSGNTDRYKITFLCGEAQGKTIAYVSYQWT
jgi:hypothetical protein